jgi:hypothetical protein
MKHKQDGFSTLWFGALAIVVVAIGLTGWRVYELRSASQISSDTSAQATLAGTVTEGPTTPVCVSTVPCERPVANHTIEAINSTGSVVATNETSSSGQYSFHLEPGRYTLVLVPKIGLPGTPNDQVDVKAGANTFNLSVDTGLK